MPSVVIQTEDFDPNELVRRMRENRSDIGAVATFTGLVRDINDGSSVSRMTLEHYPGMTERAITEIITQAGARWRILDATVVHRVGTLPPGEQIVFVAVASGHRQDAFDACSFIMDFLKTKAPFWKKEATEDGPRWVESRASDAAAAARWKRDSNASG